MESGQYKRYIRRAVHNRYLKKDKRQGQQNKGIGLEWLGKVRKYKKDILSIR